MNQRTKNINRAILQAKRRDNFTCQVSGKTKEFATLDGAHILCRNNGYKEYDPTDSRNIITLERSVHQDYDSNHSNKDKYDWLMRHDLYRYAKRLKRITGL
jgi:hypothetical protein